MIQLHRLGRDPEPFHLNPDLIVTIEAHPDTVVHLTTGANLVVTETPAEVVAAVRSWRRSMHPFQAATSPPATS
jgi:flagellar protein FlbD